MEENSLEAHINQLLDRPEKPMEQSPETNAGRWKAGERQDANGPFHYSSGFLCGQIVKRTGAATGGKASSRADKAYQKFCDSAERQVHFRREDQPQHKRAAEHL
jgi:hypothetical protein